MDSHQLEQAEQQRRSLQTALNAFFAPEDEGLRHALAAAKKGGLPEIQISPLQGKLLQFLAKACNARRILEIGSLAGYSGIWLARALPVDGRLITLEIDPHHAEVVRGSFAAAGVGERTEVRVGKALDLLPHLQSEAPFDFVFIDADKQPYPQYLEWALRLTHPGSIIVADNTIRGGQGLLPPEQVENADRAGIAAYNQDATAYYQGITGYNRQIINNPRLLSLGLAMDDGFTDGFTIALVLPEEGH